ncbi:TetR/AcrR family transcriptional regulator [Fictibacillus sp. KIGAM418]|uniref:TetR/AcrR family transcriptional regulator n=1 Tax=Fictibacillus marinisediminis TaxID=2878389 RepID=A0A9X2BB49_9BACL|nr:TetR/AcrR family transcriptional regulator [Fictibacillus marinisediminis]MCK6255609.1 TetR/AcrR family transcriptional regulator [Fictibacillus marinisediminis]
MMNVLFVTEMPTEARDKMLYAALQLYTVKGYKETSVLEIVELARVSKTTFYQSFGSKEELLAALCTQLAEEIIADVDAAVQREEKISEKAYAGIRRYIEICEMKSSAAKLLLIDSVGVSLTVENVRREAYRRFASLLYNTVQGTMPASVPDQEVLVVSQAMVGAVNEVVIQTLFESDIELDLDRLARLLNRIVVGAYVNLSL